MLVVMQQAVVTLAEAAEEQVKLAEMVTEQMAEIVRMDFQIQ